MGMPPGRCDGIAQSYFIGQYTEDLDLDDWVVEELEVTTDYD
jgi:hypothetical protein